MSNAPIALASPPAPSLFPTSSIVSKVIMALTGLGLCGFILSHMAGNLLILVGPDAYNAYSHALTSNKAFLYTAEGGLLAIFVIHVALAIKLTINNRAARPTGYAMKPNGAKRPNPASQFMIHTGMVTLIFLVLHLMLFKYGEEYWTEVNGVRMRDIHRLVVEEFHEPGEVAWYSFALLVLGVHLSHGFQSAFQSMGFNHPAWTPRIKKLGWLFAALITFGFLVQPLYVFFAMPQ